uniref:Uncharacterized protein n=1 Tax=Oryza barthii TaxID=65489 RepID=A0A0D3FJ10_9ORYZ
MGELGDASRDLASAKSLMKAADLLALHLHGGSVNPAVDASGRDQPPWRPVCTSRSGTPVTKLRDEAGEDLDAILLMLDHPNLPGVDGLI